ncbi:MAG: CsbD family protein [Lysobacteraceae bacterium]
MNSDIIKGKWKQISGRMKRQWGKLTDDDLDVVDGHREYLLGKLQERYGLSKDSAEKQIKAFEAKL